MITEEGFVLLLLSVSAFAAYMLLLAVLAEMPHQTDPRDGHTCHGRQQNGEV